MTGDKQAVLQATVDMIAETIEAMRGGSDEAAHMELIDFARLGEQLKKAAAATAEANAEARDIDAVRQWLTAKITGYRRAAYVLGRGERPESETRDLPSVSLAVLVHTLEEESARMKRIGGGEVSGNVFRRPRKQDLSQYKS